MKRYLVTLTGRANCIYGKLRANELVCSYVHANSKKKAIDLFWGEIEKNENFNCYSRRDFKIEAELWNEDELDHYGNPLKDWESAIEFSNLHLIRFNHCTGKYELADKPQESSEPVAQENIQPEPEDATESISEPQEDADAQEREKAFQRELAKIRKRKEKLIPREMIDAYNRLSDSLKGTAHYAILKMYHEYKDIDGKFKGLSWGLPREHMITIDGEEFYIKKIKDAVWLYWEFRGDVERWLLTVQALAYFNIDQGNDSEPSQSSSDEEKEIAQENPQELTESNPEPLGDIKLSDFFSITEMLLMENSEPEWAYYHNNDLIWASSKRFSKDELLRMYANGYFMPYLTDKRKNLSRIQLKEYKTMGNTERCQNLWKQIEALDEEIARLFMNGARM